MEGAQVIEKAASNFGRRFERFAHLSRSPWMHYWRDRAFNGGGRITLLANLCEDEQRGIALTRRPMRFTPEPHAVQFDTCQAVQTSAPR
jgi:hypothetical protein